MRTNLKIENSITVISEMKNETTFQVLEYDNLEGSKDINTAIQLNFLREGGVRLRQPRLLLDNSSVRIESGALSFMKGDIEIKAKTGGVIGLGKKIFSSKVTGESMIKPVYQGSGEIFLEPTFGHFALIELEDEEIIIDEGMFYACEEDVDIEIELVKSKSAMLLGNEGLIQTKLVGTGIVLLEIPVPETEIFRCKMYKDTLKVDGNFAILRSGNIEFTVEKSTKGIMGSSMSGEGFLNVYRGTGEVWLIPTKTIYNTISENRFFELTDPDGERDTEL